jgi:hypothetical protein
MLHELTGLGKVILAIVAQSLDQLGPNLVALGLVDGDILAPIGHVMLVVTRHATGHLGHEPRVAVLLLIPAVKRRTAGFVVGDGELVFKVRPRKVKAALRRLGAENLIEENAFFLGNNVICMNRERERKGCW